MFEGLGFRVWGFRVWGFGVYGLGFCWVNIPTEGIKLNSLPHKTSCDRLCVEVQIRYISPMTPVQPKNLCTHIYIYI